MIEKPRARRARNHMVDCWTEFCDPTLRQTSKNIMPRFSILDLAPVRTGGTIAEAYRNTADLAQHAARWVFTRFWLAEHHNMPGIASAATSVLIGHVACKT